MFACSTTQAAVAKSLLPQPLSQQEMAMWHHCDYEDMGGVQAVGEF